MDSSFENRANYNLYIKIVCLVLISFSFIIVRLGYDQLQSYRLAQSSLRENRIGPAISYLERVLNAHIPFSPIEEMAREILLSVGEEYLKKGDLEISLICYETVRTGMYLTRHLFIPNEGLLAHLNAKIAGIKADLLVKDGVAVSKQDAFDQQRILMERDFSPSVPLAVACVLSFTSYVMFSLVWLLRRRRVHLFTSMASLAIWIFSLCMA